MNKKKLNNELCIKLVPNIRYTYYRKMDLSKQKKEYLLELCKTNKLTGYSKLKKDMLIDKLVAAGVENIAYIPTALELSEKASTAKVTKPRELKPRLDKLNKKLEKYISGDDYKESLLKMGENIEDQSILDLLKDKTDAFITSDTLSDVDYKKYTDEYGVMNALVEYLGKMPKTNLTVMSQEQIYKMLAIYRYQNDTNIYDNLLKKFKKLSVSLHKTDKVDKVVKVDKADKADKVDKVVKEPKILKSATKSKAKKQNDDIDDIEEESDVEEESDAEEESDVEDDE